MAAQYVHDDTGTYIPATQRPDGTWRKARRVKDGYIPQDEMPLYESKGKQWAKSKPTLPVGLDQCYAMKADNMNDSQSKVIPGLGEVQTAPKPSKKKKKKKSDTTKEKEIIGGVQSLKISPLPPELPKEPLDSTVKTSQVTEPLKRLRNLRKKLKEINTLQSKIDSGELPNPEKDQLEKVARKEEIESEIEELLLELDE